MKTKLKPISKQVIVITGASSGIGLSTARMAAQKGARVVLASRNISELEQIVSEIRSRGGEAVAVEADVADPQAVDRIGEEAVRAFGGFDTWVNNAGISIYGKLTEVHLDEKRRLFDTNFWGVVHGCRTAAKHLRSRGGAIINLGSVVSDRAIPFQGIYSAAKHAIKGYTDTLRMEFEADELPISVTLVKPGAINTPYTEHAENKMEASPSFPPPVYDPSVVAEAILYCAEHPKRDMFVGASSKRISLMGRFAPRITDLVMERLMIERQKAKTPHRQDVALFSHPRKEGREHGPYKGHVRKSSLYTQSTMKPGRAIATTLGATAAVWALLQLRHLVLHEKGWHELYGSENRAA